MTVTKTRIVANFVNAKFSRGIAVFNDRLVSGERSLKVWRWTNEDYDMAESMLVSLGCKVRRVYTRTGRVRLHVVE